MRRLILLRHSKASPLAGGGDRERALNKRGLRDAPRMGRMLGEANIIPDLALISDARRTRETFRLAAATLPDEIPVRLEPRIYEALPSTLLSLIRAVPASVKTLLLVGHNPGLADLAVFLTGSGDRHAARRMAAKFPTSGLAILDFDVESWKEIAEKGGRLDRFATPASLDDANM